MERILVVLDPHHHQLNMSTVDFACYIARLTRSKLAGVFLEGITPGDHGYIPRSGDASFEDGGNVRGMPLSQVVKESRFADLIIVDPDISFSATDDNFPSRFVKDVLEGSECPVLVAPYSFDAIDEIIFTYDGSASSVFAIRQFAHLFTELSDKMATVVSVRDGGEKTLEQQFKIKEWLNAHYSGVEFVALRGSPSDELFGYLIERRSAMVVMGAYGRKMFSRFFRPSQARLVMKSVNLPVFIAHQ